MYKNYSLVIVCFLLGTAVSAQVFTNKEVGKKHKSYADSIKEAEYPYSLPILGAKATKAGYNLPYSAGLSVQYFSQQSAILIDNLQVGFNNGPMYDLDEIIRFDEAEANASAFTFRPDIWLFPFLNVYGIFGTASASTKVDFGIWIPDSTGTFNQVVSTGTVVDFQTTTFGFGITPTIGVGGGFLALDMNLTWTDVPQLSAPARTFVFGPRLGKNFRLKNPDRGIAVWVGGFRVNIKSSTQGSLALSEILQGDGGNLAEKVDAGEIKVAEYQNQVDMWWAGLSPLEQQNPVNNAKYNTAIRALDKAGNILSSADAALEEGSTSTVQYSMDKQVKNAWNFIIGSQFQYNKHWMLRAEFGFLGSRTQGMVGLQYRFGL